MGVRASGYHRRARFTFTQRLAETLVKTDWKSRNESSRRYFSFSRATPEGSSSKAQEGRFEWNLIAADGSQRESRISKWNKLHVFHGSRGGITAVAVKTSVIPWLDLGEYCQVNPGVLGYCLQEVL
jgi:hypothetical protein